MAKQRLVITEWYNTNKDLLPVHDISSQDVPYDYAIMTPDYQWHYYASYETDHGKVWRAVTITGEVIKR